ncbi:MAG TPA: 30S ribosomal protein S13 [Candidatus Omnitrophota bacterium]|nr:30S ribosomal protein S13 [Candidatus Omnitrophota bacterium]
MPRIIGVDIPREKRMDVALTYLYGIGKTLSKKVLLEAKVDFAKRAKDLTEAEVSVLTGIIQRVAKVEGDLRRDIQQNIKRLMDIRCYRGQRHLKGLPCRGQRTHTNARTRKGKRKTVGGLNRAAPAPK